MTLVLLLLLLASTPAEIHQSKPEEPTKEKPAKTDDAKTAPATAKFSLTSAEFPPKKTQPDTAEEQPSAIEKWFNPNTAPNWFIGIITFVYVGVAIGQLAAISKQAKFARRTLRAIRRQVNVGHIAAKAAKKSAEVAELALKSDRPYLLLEKAEFTGVFKLNSYGEKTGELLEQDKFRPGGIFHFRNCGKGPAILNKVCLSIITVDELPSPKDFSNCEENQITVDVLGANEHWETDSHFRGSLSYGGDSVTYNAIVDKSKTLIAYGCIWYEDVFRTPYEIGFLWQLSPPHRFQIEGVFERTMPAYFHRGPKSHNYTT